MGACSSTAGRPRNLECTQAAAQQRPGREFPVPNLQATGSRDKNPEVTGPDVPSARDPPFKVLLRTAEGKVVAMKGRSQPQGVPAYRLLRKVGEGKSNRFGKDHLVSATQLRYEARQLLLCRWLCQSISCRQSRERREGQAFLHSQSMAKQAKL